MTNLQTITDASVLTSGSKIQYVSPYQGLVGFTLNNAYDVSHIEVDEQGLIHAIVIDDASNVRQLSYELFSFGVVEAAQPTFQEAVSVPNPFADLPVTAVPTLSATPAQPRSRVIRTVTPPPVVEAPPVAPVAAYVCPVKLFLEQVTLLSPHTPNSLNLLTYEHIASTAEVLILTMADLSAAQVQGDTSETLYTLYSNIPQSTVAGVESLPLRELIVKLADAIKFYQSK